MTIDGNNELHFEFWTGIQMDGRTFKSLALFNVCREFGDMRVLSACRYLGCFPYAEDLAAIKSECKRQEDSYV